MLITASFQLSAQMIIPIGDNCIGEDAVPVNSFYNYSYSQSIYTAEELVAGEITSISYKYNANDPITISSQIYLGEVNRNEFANSSDFVPADSLTQVFVGSVVYNNGWVNITFTTPFDYSGENNLVIAYMNNSGTWVDGGPRMFNVCSGVGNKTITCYRSNEEISINSPQSVNSAMRMVLNSRPSLKVGVNPFAASCNPPIDVELQQLNNQSASFAWTAVEGVEQYAVIYKRQNDQVWGDTIFTNTNSVLLNQLETLTNYTMKVWSVCSEETSVAVSYSFTTLPPADQISTLPFICNFDSPEEASVWTVLNGNQTNKWYYGTAENSSLTSNANASGAMYISDDQGVSNHYDDASTSNVYFTRYIQFGEGAEFKLSFDWKGIAEGNSDYLRVLLLPTTFELSNNTFPTTGEVTEKLSGSNSWSREEISLSGDYANSVHKLVFFWRNDHALGEQPPIAVDNISIETITCGRVEEVFVNVEENNGSLSANVSFVDNNISEDLSYLVEYKLESSNEWIPFSTNEQNVILTDLDYSSNYVVRIKVLCSTNDNSEYSDLVYFSTPCGIITEFPWAESFEQAFVLDEGQIGSDYASKCWININQYASYYKWEQTNYYSTDGENSIRFYGYPTSGSYSDWLITPLIEFNGNQILTFKTKKAALTDTPKLKLYYYDAIEADITSMADTASFILLDEIELTHNTNGFKKIAVDLSDLANTARLALVVNEPTSEFYIDELSVSDKPLCPDVYGLTLNIATTSSIRVNFDTSNSIGTGWTIAYGQADSTGVFNPELAVDTIVVNPTDNLPITISNLSTGVYYVAVKTNCGGVYSDVESIEIPVAQILPYTQNFNDSLMYGWSFVNDTVNQWTVGSALDCGTDEGKSLYISNNNGLANAYSNNVSSISYATTNVLFGEFPAFNISFSWKSVGENNCDFAQVYLLPLSYELNTNSLPSDNYSITSRLQGQNNWQSESISLTSAYANDIYKLVFAWRNDGSGGSNPPIAIDNITITALTCGPAENLTLSTIEGSSTSIAVSFTDGNSSNVSYQIEYRAENETEWTIETTNSETHIIDSLVSETIYHVRVAVLCDNGTITEYVESTITTPCGIISTFPWIESFNVAPNYCWTQMYGEMSELITYSSDLNTSGSNGWRFSEYETVNGVYGERMYADLSYEYAKYWLVSPSFDLGNGDTIYELSADIFRRAINNDDLAPAPNGDKLAIFVSTDNGESWSTANALIFGSGENNTYDYDLSIFGLEASNVKFKLVDENNQPFIGTIKFAFYGEGSTSKILIDNLQISEWQPCQTPSMVNVGNITANSAELTFMEFGQASQWEYVISAGTTIDFATATPVVMNSTGVYLNNLVDGVTYTVAVRGVCSESQYSDWSEQITFSTPSQPTSLPFETNFSDDLDNQKWAMVANTVNAWAIGNATVSSLLEAVENDKAAYLSNNGGSSYAVTLQSGWNYSYAYLYREFDFEGGGVNHTLSFDYKVSGQVWGSSVTAGLYVLIKNEEDEIIATYTNPNEAIATFGGVNQWTRADIELPELEGIKKIVFYTWGYAQSYTQMQQVPPAIDNVVITGVICEPPTNLTVSNITANSADISWEGVSENYKVSYVVAGTQDTLSYTTSTTSYTLPLSSFENYLVSVQSVCEEDLFSLPSEILAFSTLQDADTLPYTCNFEASGNNGWLLRNGNCVNQWMIGTPAGRTSSSLFISNDSVSANYSASSSSVVIAEKLFQFDNSQYTTISFDLTIGGEITSNIYYDYLKVFLLPATEIFEPSNSMNITEDCVYATSDYAQDVILQQAGHNSICMLTGTQNITINIPTPVNEQKKLVFLWRNNYMSGTQPGAIIDNITITTTGEINEECLTPENLVVSEITATTANFAWTPQGTETQWQVKINEEMPIDVTTPNYVLTNLLPATAYNVSVRANCGAETSEWATSSFTTLDTLINPQVTTLAASVITATSAILNGQVEEGSESILERGFLFKEINSQNFETIQSNGDSEFSFLISNLQAQTSYIYKAYVTTVSNTFEGAEVVFETEQSSLSDVNSELSVSIFPNPTSETTTIEIVGLQSNAELILSDMQGKVLKQEIIASSIYHLNVKDLASGVYYVKIITEDGNIRSSKLIINK